MHNKHYHGLIATQDQIQSITDAFLHLVKTSDLNKSCVQPTAGFNKLCFYV